MTSRHVTWIFIALLALAWGFLPPFTVTLLNYIGLYSMVAVGLVLLTGVGGMTSFGQAAFVGLGAYATAWVSGNPQVGELTLTSPIGSTLAVMQWQPGEAWLRQGDQARRYDSIDTLAQEATGTPLPVRALFGWLRGEAQSVPGWQPDLSQLDNGRLNARRLMPLPTAELRVILDR